MQQRPDFPRSRLVLAVLTKYQVPEKKAVVFAALEGAWIKSLMLSRRWIPLHSMSSLTS